MIIKFKPVWFQNLSGVVTSFIQNTHGIIVVSPRVCTFIKLSPDFKFLEVRDEVSPCSGTNRLIGYYVNPVSKCITNIFEYTYFIDEEVTHFMKTVDGKIIAEFFDLDS